MRIGANIGKYGKSLENGFEFVKGYQENRTLRASFNELAEKTFGLNFEAWYQAGFWGADYIPYSAVENGRVAANVAVNHMRFCKDGKERFYLQLGTVMTDPEYRNRGLSRRLMEWIFEEYEGKVDGIYLFANDTVLDFYPRFGFRQVKEYQYYKKMSPGGAGEIRASGACLAEAKSGAGEGILTGSGNVRKVCLDTPEDWKAFAEKIKNYHTQGSFTNNNLGLLMFYVSDLFKDSVYYIEALDAYAIAEREADVLVLYDVYAKTEISPEEAAVCFGGNGELRELALGFTPKDTRGYECREYREEDTTVFVKGRGLEGFSGERKMFPMLSHA